MRDLVRTVIVAALALVVIALSNDAALAQCSMCKAVLSSARDATFIRNYNLGVLVLLVPPVTIFCSIFVALRRYKGEANEDQDSGKNQH